MLKALQEVWPMITGFLIVVSGMIAVEYSSNQKIKEHLEHLNISFSGVVTKDIRVASREHLCLVDLTFANPTSYDVRATEDVYFCVIKDDKGEFIGDSMYQLEVGDSISVIPKPMRLVNHTKNTIHEIKFPGFMTISVYRNMRKAHRL